jgi:hypothetical protein
MAITRTSTVVKSVTSLLEIQPARAASLERDVTFSRCKVEAGGLGIDE